MLRISEDTLPFVHFGHSNGNGNGGNGGVVHYCTLSLSDIRVSRQIIITNSQWSIQRLFRWVTNYTIVSRMSTPSQSFTLDCFGR